MTWHSSDAQRDTLARLAKSRAEIRRALEPPPRPGKLYIDPGAATAEPVPAETAQFPRSRIMKLLLSGRGLGTLGAMAGGLAIARPALAFRLLRMLPTGTVARMLVIKAVTALRNRPG